MALYKEIRQSDGVTTNYHRILYMTQTVNRQNSIVVVSYVDSDARALEHMSTEIQPYCKSVTYETSYDESMTIASAYDYLKTLAQFEGAEDV